MDAPNLPTQKKGLGALAWVGIGCGSLLVLGIIAFAVFAIVIAPKVKKLAEEATSNPTRAIASGMVAVSAGQIEMIAEDEVNKRYTVREKQKGKLTTIYWSSTKNAPEVIEGDFSAIPAADAVPAQTPPEPLPLPVPK